MLLSTEDIRAADAELSAIALRKILKRSEMLFVVSFISFDYSIIKKISEYSNAKKTSFVDNEQE